MSREKQIEEMIKEIEKCSCVYTPCDRECGQCSNAEMYEDTVNHIARTMYEAGYRKQSEGEWIYKFTLDGDKFYECSVCGRQEVVNCLCKERNLAEDRPYCHCGAKMKGETE